MGNDEQWKMLAKEAAEEKDPERLMKTIEALTEALDARASSRNGNGSSNDQSAA
jgi:hypothetical protein